MILNGCLNGILQQKVGRLKPDRIEQVLLNHMQGGHADDLQGNISVNRIGYQISDRAKSKFFFP